MPYTLQDVHIRQVEGGFIVRKNTVAFDEQTAAPVGQRTDEQVCFSAQEGVTVAAAFLCLTLDFTPAKPDFTLEDEDDGP